MTTTDTARTVAGPNVAPILRHFAFDHLPAPLSDVAAGFAALAHDLDTALPNGPEKATALRKLLEGKDAAVRAALDLPVRDGLCESAACFRKATHEDRDGLALCGPCWAAVEVVE